MAGMTRVATFHLFSWRSVAHAVQALTLDRVRFRGSEGLVFMRVLGTGKGRSTAPGSQVRRTALFCVFDDEDAASSFTSRVAERHGTLESWHVKLRGAGGHGAWRGRPIPQLLGSDQASPRAPSGPLAIITRADVRAARWRAFSRDARIVDEELQSSDGLLAVVGIGEAPVLRLGTFSLWRNVEAMRTFAIGGPQHARVVARTRAERWYGEEMFARFEPFWSAGSWDGRDPLGS